MVDNLANTVQNEKQQNQQNLLLYNPIIFRNNCIDF